MIINICSSLSSLTDYLTNAVPNVPIISSFFEWNKDHFILINNLGGNDFNLHQNIIIILKISLYFHYIYGISYKFLLIINYIFFLLYNKYFYFLLNKKN